MPNRETMTPAPLPGSRSEELLQNPGRGLRLEVYMEVGTGHSIFEYAGQDAIACLRESAKEYAPDHPVLAQVYFYLNHYWDKDIDEAAFARMNEYFDVLAELGIKALLRFAYVYAEDKFDAKPVISGIEPEPERIVRHLGQLKPFLAARRHQIHALQAGLIGVWGEWDLHARDRMDTDAKCVHDVTGETAVLQALLDNTPADMFIQVRYWNVKSSNLQPARRTDWERVGFHDDYLVTKPHVWNTAGGVRGSHDWIQLGEAGKTALIDGEMIWGASNKPFHEDKEIDSMAMAKRLHEHHFTSLSLHHNYRERGGQYSMVSWKKEPVTAQILKNAGLPWYPAWFLDEAGAPVVRSMYDYIRDHLGYLLVLEEAAADWSEGGVKVTLRMTNYGFAPPLALVDLAVVLLNGAGQEIARTAAFSPAALQPGCPVECSVFLPGSFAAETTSIAFAGRDGGGTPARLANSGTCRKEGFILRGPLAEKS